MCKIVCDKVVWQKLCVTKIVCDKVVCESLCDKVAGESLCDKVACERLVAKIVVCERCVRRRRRGGGGGRDGIQNQKQEPHTKMWGTILSHCSSKAWPSFLKRSLLFQHAVFELEQCLTVFQTRTNLNKYKTSKPQSSSKTPQVKSQLDACLRPCETL